MPSFTLAVEACWSFDLRAWNETQMFLIPSPVSVSRSQLTRSFICFSSIVLFSHYASDQAPSILVIEAQDDDLVSRYLRRLPPDFLLFAHFQTDQTSTYKPDKAYQLITVSSNAAVYLPQLSLSNSDTMAHIMEKPSWYTRIAELSVLPAEVYYVVRMIKWFSVSRAARWDRI